MNLRLHHGLLLAVFSAAVVTACSVKLSETGGGPNPDAECLELFETCVDLAGTSQGCEELYQHCEGSADGGSGGLEPTEGCEQDYIGCLAEGGDAMTCQPLLDACLPMGTGDGGDCDPLDPSCLGETGFDPSDTSPCGPGEPGCPDTSDPMECDARHQACPDYFPDASDQSGACDALLDACYQGDCERAVNICLETLGEVSVCRELTGCDIEDMEPGPDCEMLLAECQAQGLSAIECPNLYPEYAQCDPATFECTWYETDCAAQFSTEFCGEAGQGCLAGWLPEVFECATFFPDACAVADLGAVACENAENSCNEGFLDADNCAQTSLADNPFQWLNETAACNNWNEPG